MEDIGVKVALGAQPGYFRDGAPTKALLLSNWRQPCLLICIDFVSYVGCFWSIYKAHQSHFGFFFCIFSKYQWRRGETWRKRSMCKRESRAGQIHSTMISMIPPENEHLQIPPMTFLIEQQTVWVICWLQKTLPSWHFMWQPSWPIMGQRRCVVQHSHCKHLQLVDWRPWS